MSVASAPRLLELPLRSPRPPSAPRVLLPHGPEPAPPGLGAVLHTLGGATMGSTWSLRLAGPAKMPLARIQHSIECVLERVIAQMSTWLPTSDLCQFGRLPAGAWQALPSDFATVMRCALHVAERSGGACDPTAAPLVDAWGFGPAPRWDDPGFAPPSETALAALTVGWQGLQLVGGAEPQSAQLLQPGGLRLDLSAVAKGYAVDAVAELLAGSGLAWFLIEIGGELRASGLRPDLQPWWVALEPPAADCPLPATRVGLCDGSVATSGDYRRYHAHAGRDCPHTIDPRTRRPVAHGLASVTVLHDSCMWADAWSTALMVLGPVDGLALAEREGLAALLQWRDDAGQWRETGSTALQRWLD
jgi:thiamine biosynthesis lipoprotein